MHKSKGGFVNEEPKKKYLYKVKLKECAFLATLSDLDHDSDDEASSLSNEETDRRVEDKLNGYVSSPTPHEAFALWLLVMMRWVATARTSAAALLLRYHTPPMILRLR
jgi:hypothetical protein